MPTAELPDCLQVPHHQKKNHKQDQDQHSNVRHAVIDKRLLLRCQLGILLAVLISQSVEFIELVGNAKTVQAPDHSREHHQEQATGQPPADAPPVKRNSVLPFWGGSGASGKHYCELFDTDSGMVVGKPLLMTFTTEHDAVSRWWSHNGRYLVYAQQYLEFIQIVVIDREKNR